MSSGIISGDLGGQGIGSPRSVHLSCTPSFIQCFEDDLIKITLLKKDSSLRILALGGEICPSWKKLQNWRAEGNKTRFFNLYGLTEISCWATSFEIDPENQMLTSSIPLGNPLLDTKLEIRNEAGNISEEGELYIGSESRWCVINDEKWPENFNIIMRPTGDIVYSANDGLLYFEGRNDSIIKYKGQKLCLSLVCSALESVPEVANHVVYFNQTLKKLYLFVRYNLKEHSSSNQIRDKIMVHLRKSILNLPAVEVVFVPYIPLTRHGKADYKKLLEMSTWEQLSIVENTCNVNCEELVSSLWKAYTGQQSVADEDNFAFNGGNSSLAVQMASDIEKKLQISIPVLVQKLLNNSYHDVVELIKSSLQGQRKSLIKFERTMEKAQDYADEPPNKKKWKILCHELSCKRGYYFNCMHLKKSCCRGEKTFPRILDMAVPLKYKIDLKKCVDASPCIVHFLQSEEMLIFIGSHSGTFCAITAENGTVKWSIQLPDRIESSSCVSYCGKYVLVGCYDYHFYCFDLKKGVVTWKYKTGAEVKSSPVVSCSNVAFVGSHDKHLYAVNVETGNLEWKREISKGSIFSSPALVEQLSSVCVTTLDGTISMLKMVSGEVIWTYHYGKPVFSSPSTTLTSIFVGSTDNSMLHFDLSGNMVSKYHTCAPVFSSACIISSEKSESIVFGCDDCYIYYINSQAECRWKTQCDSPVYATPFTFQWLNQTCIVVASTSGTLYILKEDNGEVLQSWKVPGKVFSSPVVLNNVLTFGSRDNNVYIYNL
ncbi:beta-alanine-activating enzyme-like [Stegodyphus dumicola]|uniref:beta-alanine-activating enzyme-like n=1 Tax=Stegodyphus dumicola TaxID=202533 RepID=UPI0015AF9915|nr:beta-alanine-activating enzyme-like [Stegodyphus dumicola]